MRDMSEAKALKAPIEEVSSALVNKGKRLTALREFAGEILNPTVVKRLAKQYVSNATRNPNVRLH